MQKKILIGLLITFGLFFVVLGPFRSNAAGGGVSISVVPPKFELWGNPGEEVPEQSMKITNESDVPMTFSITTEDFLAQGEDGSVNLLEEDQSNNTYSLAKWIEVGTKSSSFAPRETKVINYKINIPKNAEPGGRYVSIVINAGGQAKVSSGASVSSRVVSLVLLKKKRKSRKKKKKPQKTLTASRKKTNT